LNQLPVEGRRQPFDFVFAAHFRLYGLISILEMWSKRIIYFIRIPGARFQSRFGMAPRRRVGRRSG
jgi:hypothetical protein